MALAVRLLRYLEDASGKFSTPCLEIPRTLYLWILTFSVGFTWLYSANFLRFLGFFRRL